MAGSEAIELERKIDFVQRTTLVCFRDAWMEEHRLRGELKKAHDRIDELLNRLTVLESKLEAHARYGDYCPHTGR